MSADNLMARVNEARDRLREARNEALAATGAIKGIVVSSLILEHKALKAAYDRLENYKSISGWHRQKFMNQQLDIIKADPSHPLRGLLDNKGDNWFGRNHGKPQQQIGVQAGHLRSRFALLQELDGELERFAVEDAMSNVGLDSRMEGQGVIYEKTALDIGGVPVETGTAKDYAKLGYIDENVVANAPQHPGWTAPNSLFTESIPDAAGSSQLRGILRAGSNALGPLGAAVDVYYLGDAINKDGGTFGENTKTTVGGIAGGLGGAAAGAALGTLIFPGVGTVVGGMIGGVAGSMGGEWLGDLL